MSTMEAEVFDAFRAAGVPDDKAMAAAQRLNRRDTRVSAVESDVILLKWMVGFNLALTMAVLLKLFIH
jgi:hypothetical protein